MMLNRKNIVPFLLLLFCLVSPAISQISFHSELDNNQMVIGDHMRLQLFATGMQDIENFKPDYTLIDSLDEVEIIKKSGWEKANVNGVEIFKQDLIFTVFDSGYYILPGIPIYQNNNVQSKFNTENLGIEVLTVAVNDSTQLMPIKPIIQESWHISEYYSILYFLGGLLLVGLIGYFLYKRFFLKEKVVVEPPKRIIPAHETALEKLEKLKAEQLWQKGEIKAYQSELSYIIREYIENRWKLPALESTTYEILGSDIKNLISDDQLKELKGLLEMSDMVKFAKAVPAIEIHSQVMEFTEQFIYSTKLPDIIAAEPNNE